MTLDAVVARRQWFGEQGTAMVALLRQLVAHETPSGDVARINALQEVVAALFADAGGAVERISGTAGDHLRVRFFNRSAEAAPTRETRAGSCLILCHVDTVWDVGAFPGGVWQESAGIGRGPGAFDMKGGIVCLLFALRALQSAADMRPVTVLLTCDEEVGSRTSRALIEAEATEAAHVLVLESSLPGGVLKTARKGVGGFRLLVAGRAAHAGVEPEKGVSATQEIAHQTLAIHALNAPADGTTVNVGVIAAGTRPNVVAAAAQAEIDVRVTTQAEARRVETALQALVPVNPAAQLRVEGGFNRPPFERTPPIAALFDRANTITAALGLPPLRDGATGGGSDGNFTAALGVPTLDGLGPEGAGAHADDEQIVLASLPERAYLLAGLLVGL